MGVNSNEGSPGIRGTLRGRIGIASGLDVVIISDSEILIQHGTGSRPAELIRDTDLTGVLGRLMHALETGDADLQELLSLFTGEDRAEAEDLIDQLVASRILADSSRSAVQQYLGFSMGAESSLESARVSVIGAGPVGARIADTLVRHGIGELRILDERATDAIWHAYVAPAHRGEKPVGEPAHQVLCDQLSGGATQVTALSGGFAPGAIADAVREVDLVVMAIEHVHPRLAHLVNRACLRVGTPWLLAQVDGAQRPLDSVDIPAVSGGVRMILSSEKRSSTAAGAAGPLFYPPHTACYNDFEVLARSISTNAAMDRLFHRHLQIRGTASFFPGLPSYVDIVAGYVGLAAVEYLLTGSSWALERVTTIDFDSMVIDTQDLLRLPRCPVCGGGSAPLHPPFPASPPPGGAW